MISQIIFRISMWLMLVCLLVITLGSWIGSQIPMTLYAYVPYRDNDTLKLGDSLHIWTMRIADITDRAFDWSPDGRTLFYAARSGGGSHWCMYRFGEGQICSGIRSHTGTDQAFTLSYDGRYFAALNRGEVYVWDTRTLEQRVVFRSRNRSLAQGVPMGFLPQSYQLIFADSQDLWQIDVITGEDEIINSTDAHILRVAVPATGSMIAYHTVQTSQHIISLFDLTQREVVGSLTIPHIEAVRMIWSPDGEKLLIREESNFHIMTVQDTIHSM